MSASAKLKLKMEKKEVIEKMCERNGWKLEINGGMAYVKVLTSSTSNPYIDRYKAIRVDLSGKLAPYYDEDFRSEIFKELLGRLPTDKELERVPNDVVRRNADVLIEDLLQTQYDMSSVIIDAEAEGLQWEEYTSDEGYPVIDVDYEEEGNVLDISYE